MATVDEATPVLKHQLDQLLEDHVAWPVREFKLSMELRELYQNTTGVAMDQLDDVHTVSVDEDRYYVRESTSSNAVQNSQVYQKKNRINEFLSESGNIANLVAYIATCQVYSELNIGGMGVRPEDNHGATLYHTSREPDVLVIFSEEYMPIEVYNGADYFNTNNNKNEQLEDLSSHREIDVSSNPMFINRRSMQQFHEHMMKMNSVVVDTDIIFTSEQTHQEYASDIEFFNIGGMIMAMPKLTGANGDQLGGDDYDVQANGELEYSAEERREALLPADEMLTDVDQIPPEYLQRVRGGIQLHYVNTLYRRTEDTERGAAALVTQNMYNDILRKNEGKPIDTAITDGWNSASGNFRWLDDCDRDRVFDETKEIIGELSDDRVITVREEEITPRQSTHPQPPFSFGAVQQDI